MNREVVLLKYFYSTSFVVAQNVSKLNLKIRYRKYISIENLSSVESILVEYNKPSRAVNLILIEPVYLLGKFICKYF